MDPKESTEPTQCDVDDDSRSDTTEELIIVTPDPLAIDSPSSPPELSIDEAVDSPITIDLEETIDDSTTKEHTLESPSTEQFPTIRNRTSCMNCKLKTFAANTSGRSQQIREEIVAIRELQTNTIAYSLLNAPREYLREFLRGKIAFPRPRGAQNFLNIIFADGKTLLHGSVLQNRYDITDLLLFYGADVNIRENNRTILHHAVEKNDTLLFNIAASYGADLLAYNELGETPLLTAVAYNNQDVLVSLWRQVKEHLPSINNESVFHYAARYNNVKIAKLACDPRYKIDIHMISKHEQRTALHIAVMGSRVEIVEIFLHHGARDNKEDKTGVFAFEYITNCDIKNLFLRYGMRITDGDSMAEKRKSTSETAASASKQLCLTLIKDSSALMRTLLRAEHTQTAQQPLRREIEGFPLYDPSDKRTNSFMYLEAAGFPREVLLSEAMPIEAPIPNKYKIAYKPKIVYVITSPREFQLHVTLLNAAYTRKIVFCNRAWYRRDLYEIYLWERSNITKAYQDYKEKLMNSLQGTATATTFKIPTTSKKPTTSRTPIPTKMPHLIPVAPPQVSPLDLSSKSK
jgi:ankyrin repeat protein